MIRILYFARLREELGRAGDEIEPGGLVTVADVVNALCQRGDPWAVALGEGQTVLAAVNQEMARPETPVRDGDEVAFFPPVTGG